MKRYRKRIHINELGLKENLLFFEALTHKLNDVEHHDDKNLNFETFICSISENYIMELPYNDRLEILDEQYALKS